MYIGKTYLVKIKKIQCVDNVQIFNFNCNVTTSLILLFK